MNKISLTSIILTFNEELHIERCLKNVCLISEKVYVIDCFSKDRTCEIASKFENVEVVQHEWPGNQAAQFNWFIDNHEIASDWILRLDADEYLEDALIERMQRELPTLPEDVTAIDIRLKHVFLGKFIKGGSGKKYMSRFFKYGKAKSENRQMDEHMEISEGRKIQWEEAFYDDNLNHLGWWTTKHNGYSIREAVDLLDAEYGFTDLNDGSTIGGQASGTRRAKLRYAKLPLFWRSFAYFLYRYFLKGGCLEGKEGFIWCFLQGWWYRTLVDAKIYEIKKVCGNDKEKIREYLKNEYNIVL